MKESLKHDKNAASMGVDVFPKGDIKTCLTLEMDEEQAYLIAAIFTCKGIKNYLSNGGKDDATDRILELLKDYGIDNEVKIIKNLNKLRDFLKDNKEE